MRITFWQNIPSPHQSPHIRALAALPGVEVVLLAEHDLPKWRRDLGWSTPDFGRAIVQLAPSQATLQGIIRDIRAGDVHLFSGMRAYPMVWQAFRQVIRTEALVGLISEPSDWRGAPGVARLLRARADRVRYGRHAHLIFAIGHLALRWFALAGYKKRRLFPFVYTTEAPDSPGRSEDALIPEVPQLFFMGQCVPRKGIDLLLAALASLSDLRWHLTVAGDGEARPQLEAQSRMLGLERRVTFTGSLANHQAMRLLERSDLLILPSRWDGWGAVVNEALMRGVPVVCSDRCGASDLLGDPERGRTFVSECTSDLRAALATELDAGPLAPARAERIRQWSRAISGEVVAAYLLDVLQCVAACSETRPTPPWLAGSSG